MSRRKLIYALVIFSVLQGVSSIYGSQAQAATTITSLETFTTLMTSTSYSYFAQGTSYVTSTTEQDLFSGPFTLAGISNTNYGCEYHDFPFTATKGQSVSGQFTSSRIISFYMMTDNSFKKWDATSKCDVNTDTLARKVGILSYSLEVNIPYDGTYHFVFLNFGPSGADVNFNVGTGSVTTVVTTTLYFGFTQRYVFTSTGLRSQYYTQSVPETAFLDQTGLLLVAIVVIAIVAAADLYRKQIRKEHSGSTMVPEQTKESLNAVERMFCRKCGARISRNHKFCLKCGAPL